MADLAVIDRVRLIEPLGERAEVSVPAGAALAPGAPARFDANGKAIAADATVAGNAAAYGLNATRGVNQANITCQVVRRGKVALYDANGANVLAGLAYGAQVFLSNTPGRLADAAGTVSVAMGRVVPFWSANPPEKVLELDVR
ncbi:MAG: hypothetical protein OZ924_10670 [Burkholderiaceae bacterium]|nr:hypothetical protein [Burkholderiaceae bacterium]